MMSKRGSLLVFREEFGSNWCKKKNPNPNILIYIMCKLLLLKQKLLDPLHMAQIQALTHQPMNCSNGFFFPFIFLWIQTFESELFLIKLAALITVPPSLILECQTFALIPCIKKNKKSSVGSHQKPSYSNILFLTKAQQLPPGSSQAGKKDSLSHCCSPTNDVQKHTVRSPKPELMLVINLLDSTCTQDCYGRRTLHVYTTEMMSTVSFKIADHFVGKDWYQ